MKALLRYLTPFTIFKPDEAWLSEKPPLNPNSGYVEIEITWVETFRRGQLQSVGLRLIQFQVER